MGEFSRESKATPGAVAAPIRRALWCYVFSLLVILGGALVAGRQYPLGFDWTRDVISALASRKHNPEGSVWFAGALLVSLGLLLPVSGVIRSSVGESLLARRAAGALRLGLMCGILVAVDRLAFFHLSALVRKAHEILALASFASLYLGVIGIEIEHVRWHAGGWWRPALILFPLVAVGVLELWLYIAQRDVGWLEPKSRSMPAFFWARFAFWQWVAAFMLWLGVGHLLTVACRRLRDGDSSRSATGREPRDSRVSG